MENIVISQDSMNGMLFTAVIAITLPFVFLFIARIRMKAKYSPFFIGCVTYVFAVLFLGAFFNGIVFRMTNGVLKEHVAMYALFSGLSTAVFEEFGRYLAMRYCMKNSLTKQNAFMYGVGHSGIYSIAIVGLSYIANISMASMINSGQMTTVLADMDEAMRAETIAGMEMLWTAPASDFYVAGIERISALILQLIFSYLVYRSIRFHDYRMLVAALVLHFLVECFTIIFSQMIPILALEGILLVTTIAIGFFVIKLYKEEPDEPAPAIKSIVKK